MPRFFIAFCAALLLLGSSAPALAGLQRVEPGSLPELEADEGLLLIAVDSSVPLNRVQVIKDGKWFGAGMLRSLPAGRSYTLYVAPAGRYEFREVRVIHELRIPFRDDPEFKFEVTAGGITYPGDLLFRPNGWWSAQVNVVNRGLAAIDWLEAEHPALYQKHEFAYAGHYPDPFPAFFASERRASANTGSSTASTKDPGATALPIAVEQLWRPERILQARINPSGTLIAMELLNDSDGGDHDDQRRSTTLSLIDLQAGTSETVIKSAQPMNQVEWSGDDNLLLSAGGNGQPNRLLVIRSRRGPDGLRHFERITMPRPGRLLDPLPEAADEILFSSYSRKGELEVHRLNISDQASVNRFMFSFRQRLNRGVEHDLAWLTDASGTLRLATAQRDEDIVLLHGRDGEFRQVLILSDELDFEPMGLSGDGREIYGLTDKDREQRELVAWDIAAGKISRTLFSRPGVDVVAPLLDAKHQPIGASYVSHGRLVNHYFASTEQRTQQALAAAFGGQSIAVIDQSRNGRRSLLWVEAADHPPRLYFFDADLLRAELIDSSAPWLDAHTFASTDILHFKGSDGLALEGFLTLPPGDTPRPLLVMPHGGPIGVADTLAFDRDVQFLAALGYAVLRVNFRGSSGYGKAFQEAGHGNYGTLIEDDIDAAIRYAQAHYPIDAQRMCMLGSSYGGYSALIAAVRWPDRFRCAVSIAGVTDLILFFTASDGARNAKVRARLEQIIGDPKTQAEAMQASSPIYQYQRLQLPVMLVHGTDDHRVDIEHSRRLARLLRLAGRPPVELEIAEAGHGFHKREDLERVWGGVADFLAQSLQPVGGTAQTKD